MKNNCKLRKVTEHGRLVFNGGEKMVQIEDKDSALIGAIEICGELQSELARAIIYDKNEYEILRRYYNLSASLQNAGINVNADIRILHNTKENQKN